MADVTCPSCGGARLRRRGAVPRNDAFAGAVVEGGFAPRTLWACHDCLLGFTSPRPDRDRLAALYAAGAEDSWTPEPGSRADWRLARSWLAGRPAGTEVLDVGCWDGGFLAALGGGRRLRGVEPHPGAAARAAARGVDVLCPDYAELPALGRSFDVITAFDVIEHVLDPREFLATLRACLAPGGTVLVATGSTEALAWRLQGSRYWYSWFNEHVSFVGPAWFTRTAPRLGLAVQRREAFAHGSREPRARAVDLVKNVAYRAAPGLVTRARGGATTPPGWLSARDHVLVELSAATAPGGTTRG